MKKIVLPSLLLFVILPLVASAHLPRYMMGENVSLHSPAEIDNPTVSQVFYGQMQGTPDYYHFYLSQPNDILIGLLTPINETRSPQVELIAQKGKVQNLTGNLTEVYFEKFGNDYYRRGPEKTFSLPADNYLIKVYNASSTGRYALVIGSEEKFSVGEMLKTIFVLPIIKQKFFDQPILELFLASLGLVLLALGLSRTLTSRFQTSFKLFVFGAGLFTLSSVFLLAKNFFNILDWLKLIFLLIALAVSIWYFWKKPLNKKRLLWVQTLLWLLVLFLTVASL